MVKLSRPSSLGRNRSTNGTNKSSWTNPVEFNRSPSSKRWGSFRKAESAGGESEFTRTGSSFTLTRSTSKSKSKSEPIEFDRAGSSFNRVASAADSFLATGTLEECDSDADLTVGRSRSRGGNLKKSFSLTSRKSSIEDRRNDDDDNLLAWANPFTAIFGDDTSEFRDDDDDYSQFTYDSAGQMTVGTEQTGATDTGIRQGASSFNGDAQDAGLLGAFARSVSNHFNPDHSDIGEENEDDEGESHYNLEARSSVSGRDSSSYSTDEEEGASSYDEDDDGNNDGNDTRRISLHSFDAKEERETEAVASGVNTAVAVSDPKDKSEPDETYLYQFSTRVRVNDGTDRPSKKSTRVKKSEKVWETSNTPSTEEPTETKKSRGRSLKKMVPKFRASSVKKSGSKLSAKKAGAGAKPTATAASSPSKAQKKSIKTKSKAGADKRTENEAALLDMMESARQVAAEESREIVLLPSDDDVVQSQISFGYSHAPTVAPNKTRMASRSSRSLASMTAKRSERKNSAKIKRDIRNRDKAREATLRRIEAEERKQLKSEKKQAEIADKAREATLRHIEAEESKRLKIEKIKNEAEIAAANAKEAEARAKIASLVAKARLKKQQDEAVAKLRSSAKAKETEPAEEKTGTVHNPGSTTSSNEEAPGGSIPLSSRARSIEDGVLRAADAVDLFLATGKLGADSAPSSPRRSRSLSRLPSKITESDDCGESKTTKSKRFARVRSVPRAMPRARSLSRPSLFRKRQGRKYLEEEDEDDESVTVEEEPVDVSVFKKKERKEWREAQGEAAEAAEAATTPRGIPTISSWKQNRDGSISGFISGSPDFDDGEFVTTSPIKGEASDGEVVRTGSGSKYFLAHENGTLERQKESSNLETAQQPPDVDMDYTLTYSEDASEDSSEDASEEASEGYSVDSSYMSEDASRDEPPPPHSAVSELLPQPAVSPLLPPLPASPQHSVSSRSMTTYDPTAPSSPRSIGSEQYENSSFARSASTYRPGEINTSGDLRPSSPRNQPSPKRSVSFQRIDNGRNDVIVEEEIEDILEQSMNDTTLHTNVKLSPRAAGSKNTFCIHEYDEEGHQAVVYNEFSSSPIRSLKIYQYDCPPGINGSSRDVLVKIQASTVSYSDCIIRQGKWWGSDKMTPPITPGVDFVGKICSVGDEAASMYGYRSGDSVASLVRCGGNARYAVIDAAKLVDVPSEVEPTQAACMLETYLAAFQSLHLGEDDDTRYEKTSMLGKSVLIIGGIAMVGQAMIELAFLAGASTIYVTAREKHHDFLRSLGTIPLSMDVEEWLPSVKGRMDLVVDAYCTNHFSETVDALNSSGKMVCIRTKSSMLENDPGLLWEAEAFLTKMGMSSLSQTFAYDVYESWDENIDLCKDDMMHLFGLLKKGLVEPPIADCLPLTKVPQAQKLFETKRIQGFFVCEPWLKKKQKAGFC